MLFAVLILLVAGNSAQVGAVLLHLISKGLLRATELSGDSTVGDALRMILPSIFITGFPKTSMLRWQSIQQSLQLLLYVDK